VLIRNKLFAAVHVGLPPLAFLSFHFREINGLRQRLSFCKISYRNVCTDRLIRVTRTEEILNILNNKTPFILIMW
jgi:hypothetical protein